MSLGVLVTLHLHYLSIVMNVYCLHAGTKGYTKVAPDGSKAVRLSALSDRSVSIHPSVHFNHYSDAVKMSII